MEDSERLGIGPWLGLVALDTVTFVVIAVHLLHSSVCLVVTRCGICLHVRRRGICCGH